MLDKVDNLRRVLRGERPERIPVECTLDPRFGEGAATLVPWRGSLPPRLGGVCLWGITWQGHGDTLLPYPEHHPVQTLEEVLALPFPDIRGPERWQEAQAQVAEMRGRSLPVAWHTAGAWERLWFLMGMKNAFMALVDDPDLAAAALHKIVDWQLVVADQFISIGVEAVRISDDYGAQKDLLMSPRAWRRIIKPELARLVGHYQRAGVPVILHSCGNVSRIMDDLVELGIVAFNIQTNANDLAAYRQRYGGRFAVWGGISAQGVLANGTPDEVRVAVRQAVTTLGADGGLILEPDQVIQVPEASLQAFWDEAMRLRA